MLRRGQTSGTEPLPSVLTSGCQVADLEFYSELGGDELFAYLNFCVLVSETVLHFALQIIGKTITDRGIDAPSTVAPSNALFFIPHCPENLLVPAHRAEKLRSEFIFGLEIIREGVCVPDSRYFESCFEEFGPELPMVPGKRHVLPEKKFPIIVDVAAWRQCLRRLGN